jgi:sugar O-acyltransferase (sialic acid O-acetyltransferase NeuD family)
LLAILGAGGHGKVVADCAAAAGWTDIGFFDDAIPVGTLVAARWPVLGASTELLARAREFGGTIIAVGDNRTRLEWHESLAAAGAKFATVVHPSAIVSADVTIGDGTVLVAGAIINIGTNIGKSAIVNTGATIDHDCLLGDGVHVSPGANLAGGVSVGTGSWIGIGAAVIGKIDIGNYVRVGAGAVVIKSVANGLTVVGNPARSIERN